MHKRLNSDLINIVKDKKIALHSNYVSAVPKYIQASQANPNPKLDPYYRNITYNNNIILVGGKKFNVFSNPNQSKVICTNEEYNNDKTELMSNFIHQRCKSEAIGPNTAATKQNEINQVMNVKNNELFTLINNINRIKLQKKIRKLSDKNTPTSENRAVKSHVKNSSMMRESYEHGESVNELIPSKIEQKLRSKSNFSSERVSLNKSTGNTSSTKPGSKIGFVRVEKQYKPLPTDHHHINSLGHKNLGKIEGKYSTLDKDENNSKNTMIKYIVKNQKKNLFTLPVSMIPTKVQSPEIISTTNANQPQTIVDSTIDRWEEKKKKYKQDKEALLLKIKSNNELATSSEFYRVGKMLGKGAFGKVNLGMHKLSGKMVAIKSINKEFLTDDHSKSKVMREVSILKQLTHPSVIKLFETFESKKHILLVMELCVGGDLLTYVRKRRKLTEPVAKYVFKQVYQLPDY